MRQTYDQTYLENISLISHEFCPINSVCICGGRGTWGSEDKTMALDNKDTDACLNSSVNL